MIRASNGDLILRQAVWIAVSVNTFVVVANDLGDVAVVIDFGENSFADLGVRLHDATFFESQRSLLLEQARGQPNLADVVDEAREVYLLLLCLGESHPCGDVARVDRDRCRVTCGVPVSGVQRRDESRGEREVRLLKSLVGLVSSSARRTLILIESEESSALRGRARRTATSASGDTAGIVDKERNKRHVERNCSEEERRQRLRVSRTVPRIPEWLERHRCESDVEQVRDNGAAKRRHSDRPEGHLPVLRMSEPAPRALCRPGQRTAGRVNRPLQVGPTQVSPASSGPTISASSGPNATAVKSNGKHRDRSRVDRLPKRDAVPFSQSRDRRKRGQPPTARQRVSV